MSPETTDPMPTPETPARTLAERWRALRDRRAVRWGMDLLLMVAVLIGVTAWQTRDLLDDSEPLPGFTLERLEDGAAVTSDSLGGKPTVVVFWAPWCTVCKLETGTISSLAESYAGEANVVSVVLGYEERGEVEAFVREHHVDYPVLLGEPELARDWRISAFPTIYVLNEEGKISSSVVGYTTGLGLRARLIAARYL